MKKALPIVFALLALFMLSGCYEVYIDIQFNDAGQTYVTHYIVVPKRAFELQLGKIGIEQKRALEILQDIAHKDALMIGDTHVTGRESFFGQDRVVLLREFVFDNHRALSDYLSLLGLRATIKERRTFFCRKLKGYDVTVEADTLDMNKLLHSNELFSTPEDSNEELPSFLGEDAKKFTLKVYLPGEQNAVEPQAEVEWLYRKWSIQGPDLKKPFRTFISNTFPRRDAIAGVKRPTAPLPTLDAPAAALTDQGRFADLMNGRFYPVLHARVQRNGKIDLNYLPVYTDETTPLNSYLRLSEWVLLPETIANYQEWLETIELDGETRLGFGTRNREPFAAQDVAHLLQVAADGRSAMFYPPKLYADATKAAGDPERVAMVVMVTFADGSTAQAPVRAKDLAGGAPIMVKP
ncbi:MAG TPA: hypothetical protein PK961_18040 [bacterium]|nr:hypothetical protein [bacterium]